MYHGGGSWLDDLNESQQSWLINNQVAPFNKLYIPSSFTSSALLVVDHSENSPIRPFGNPYYPSYSKSAMTSPRIAILTWPELVGPGLLSSQNHISS